MKIWVSDNMIYFRDEKMRTLAYTEYDKSLYEKVKDVNWTVSKGRYLYSSKLKQSLHQVVMVHWYGEDVFVESRKKGFIVEHHNNNGFDCRIINLSFVPEPINKAKAFTYDKDRLNVMSSIAVNFYKNFSTGQYQVTIAFNKPYYIVFPRENKKISVAALYLLYEDDFFRTLTDATSIIHELRTYGKIPLLKLKYKKILYEEAILIELEPGKEDALFFELEGKFYVRLGTEHLIINEAAPKKSLYNISDNDST